MEVSRQRRPADSRWIPALKAFGERLRWRCHFTQKLERAPRIEHHDLFRPMATVREHFDPERFAAWSTGNTGWPLVDACMRSLAERGWLNFRMRALLVSTATHHLWLPWRPVALHLARHFVDYDPGIHYPQVQMQAGSTGINALRIYNPTRQAREQDPTGAFIRRFVPELDAIDDRWLAQPWEAPSAQRRGYPEPLVDLHRAAESARVRLESVRKSAEAQQAARRILLRHGSRRPGRW
jgi:deoxyribodipyrimidine photo-lyase